MKFLKRMVQTAVAASLLQVGVAKAENEHDFWVYGSPEAKHDEYIQRGYFKAPESARYGFSLYLNQTDTITLSRLEQQLAKLPVSFRSALKEVRINNLNETVQGGDTGGRGGVDGALAIYSRAGLTNGHFLHECGHVWVESLTSEKKQEFLKRWDMVAQFNYGSHNVALNKTEWKTGSKVERWRSLGTRIDSLKPLLAKEKAELETLRERIENDSQSNEGDITRNEFNARAEKFNNQSEKFTRDVDEYNRLFPCRNEPREGIFSAYGAMSRGEDIAEAAKTIIHNPPRARALFTSPDERYAKKMHLLAEYGNFKLEEYLNKK